MDLPRPGAETILFSIKGRKIFCARARRIHLWIYRARIFCARARRIHIWIYRARSRKRFFLYIGEKNFCARARRIHIWIYRARARKRFSSLYRGENFLRSGAENPPLDLPRPDFLRSGAENPHLDLPRPGAETIFSLYRGEKFSALGRGESTFGSTAPGFSALGRGESTFGSTAPGRGNDFFSI